MAIYFHTENISFRFNRKRIIRGKIKHLIHTEGFLSGEINIIFCSDEYLLGINKKYLDHHYYTDIVTFNYNSDKTISGDLFISVERVKENAKTLSVSTQEELDRVIIHGVLHLCAYNDKSPQEQTLMRAKENFYLK